MPKQQRPRPRRPAPIYLREWLKYRHLTAEKLAEKLDTSKSVISKLESGEQRWNSDWLEAVAYVLDCDVPELYRRPTAGPDLPPEVRDAMRVIADYTKE